MRKLLLIGNWQGEKKKKKSGLKRKLIVSTLDIPIERLGLKVSN